MRTLRKMILCSLLAGTATAASAQTYSYLTLQQQNGSETSLSIDGLKITFDNGNLVATNGSESTTIPLVNMQKLYFATQPTGIDGVEGTSATVSATIVGGRLQVNAPEGSAVSVYSIDGRQVGTENLSAGAYVVKVAGRTFKVLSK